MLTFILIIYLHFTVVVLVIIETKNWLSLAKKKDALLSLQTIVKY